MEWQKELTGENRNTVISKIADVLKDYPGADQSKILPLAARYEQTVYGQATSKKEYFHNIANKIYALKAKQNGNQAGGVPMAGSTPQTAIDISAGHGSMGMNQPMQNVPHGLSSLPLAGMQPVQMGMQMNPAAMNMGHPQSMGMQMNPERMANAPGIAPPPVGIAQSSVGIAQNPGISSLPIQMNQGHPQSMPTQNQGMPNPSYFNNIPPPGMNPGDGLPQATLQNMPPDERKYWEKHTSLKQYIRPLAAMIKQIERLLEGYSGDQEKNLQTIQKKLTYMYALLQETPGTRKGSTPFEEGYKVLEAAERQIQHWIQQLSGSSGAQGRNLLQPGAKPPQAPIKQAQPPMQQMNPQQMNPQQMNPQQMNTQQMNPQQMNPQQMGQQQMNPQQMNPQQMNPQQMGQQQMNPQQMGQQQMNQQQMNPQQMNQQQMNQQMSTQLQQRTSQHSQQIPQQQLPQQISQQQLPQQVPQQMSNQMSNPMGSSSMNPQMQQGIKPGMPVPQQIPQQMTPIPPPGSAMSSPQIQQQMSINQQHVPSHGMPQHPQIQNLGGMPVQQQMGATHVGMAQQTPSAPGSHVPAQQNPAVGMHHAQMGTAPNRPNQGVPQQQQQQIPQHLQMLAQQPLGTPKPMQANPAIPSSGMMSATKAAAQPPKLPTAPSPMMPQTSVSKQVPLSQVRSNSSLGNVPEVKPPTLLQESVDNPVIGFLERLNRLDNRDAKDIGAMLEKYNKSSSFLGKELASESLSDASIDHYRTFWWDLPPKSEESSEKVLIGKSSFTETFECAEKRVCDDYQKSLKKRKLSGQPPFSATKILRNIKEELSKSVGESDGYFMPVKIDSSSSDILVIEKVQKDDPTKIFIFFEPESSSAVMHEPSRIYPKVTYGTSFETSQKFPVGIEIAVEKSFKEAPSEVIEHYKAYFKHLEVLKRESSFLSESFLFEFFIGMNATKISCVYAGSNNTIISPAVDVSVTFDYPNSSPTYSFSEDVKRFLPEAKRIFDSKMRTMQHPFSLTALLDLWKSVLEHDVQIVGPLQSVLL